MPVTCQRCSRELVAGSLRCKHCGADAREAPAVPGVLSMSDVFGHDSDEVFCASIMGWDFVRRNKIVDQIGAISQEVLAWARLPEETRGPMPVVSAEQQAEIDALFEEYNSLLPKK